MYKARVLEALKLNVEVLSLILHFFRYLRELRPNIFDRLYFQSMKKTQFFSTSTVLFLLTAEALKLNLRNP